MRVVPAELAGKTKFPSVQATTELRVGEVTAPKTCGWAPRTTCAPALSAAAASCCCRSDGPGASSVPQWNQQTTTSAWRRAARTAAATVSGSAFAVPGESAVALNPYGLTSESPTKPIRSPPAVTITGRSAAAALTPPPTVSRPAACAYLIVSEQGDRAVVARMVVRDRDDVEAARVVRAPEQGRRAAEVEFLVRHRRRRASTPLLRGSPSPRPQRAASVRPATTGSRCRASTRSRRPLLPS